jgi:putative mRNA 3-end processing factor
VGPLANKQARAFTYRAGVRLSGTVVACDASAGSDLIFLSHARALDARGTRALPRPRAGKRQLLTTETTLALLGGAGERLRPHALLASAGKPFTLGPLRLELHASGFMPGAASLLCEVEGRRLVYTGPVGTDTAATLPRAAALCLDAAFGAARFRFPSAAEALADLRAFVTGALAARRAPVVLVDPFGPALDAGAALAAAGVALRAHRSVMAAAADFRRAGLATPPLQRFDGRLRPGEALLWPPEARGAPRLGALAAPAVVLASPWAADPAEVVRARADRGVALSSHADFTGLLRLVEATGASEVALVRAPGEELAAALRARGLDAYLLGPPDQIALFSTADAAPAA